jgi:hypothetical protein
LITAIMFFYVFGVLCFYYILDPLRKSLFLSNIASRQLPYAYLLTAFSREPSQRLLSNSANGHRPSPF